MEVDDGGLAEIFGRAVLIVRFLIDGQNISQHQTRFVPGPKREAFVKFHSKVDWIRLDLRFEIRLD